MRQVLRFLRRCLVDVYRTKLLEVDSQLDTELHRILQGYEKVINNLKERGLMKINDGKRQLKASGFELLVLKLMTLEPVKKHQACSTVLFSWIFSYSYCLVVEEQGYKGHQIRAAKFGKHVYANSYKSSLCPVFALVIHLCPQRGTGGKQQSVHMRLIPEGIGTHSLRKGSRSYALGQVNSPTPVGAELGKA
ncbi:hypothetical protein PHMEG_00041729 [Phytophthora megakarya]|uniref:Uncharacterized protein n=1 Tax=Phytophthora megakarya TaxID=4795 RepID=A0A225UB13_9STRA|nr:hypothetical protein PHMEG_00041729 [Phytophthora megakarya]